MKKQQVYDIIEADGSITQMTARQAAERSGIALGTIAKRLQRQGIRTAERLFRCPNEVRAESRRRFSQQTAAHFSEEKRTREARASRGLRPSWRDYRAS